MLNSNQCCDKPKHVHELTGATKVYNECCDCHYHRFCTVTSEEIPVACNDHIHEVKFRTDTADGHYHEFCGKTCGPIEVGGGKHVHYLKDWTMVEDCHKHEFQVATLINDPTKFKCKCMD